MPLEEKQRVITASSGTMKTNKQDDKIKSEWHKKSIGGYLIVCEQLIENLHEDVSGES